MVHDMFTALKDVPDGLCRNDMKQSLIQVVCLTLPSTPSPKHPSTDHILISTSPTSILSRAFPHPHPLLHTDPRPSVPAPNSTTPITYSVSVLAHDFSSLSLPNP